MAGRTYVANESKVPLGTVSQLILEAVDAYGDALALRGFVGESNDFRDYSYRETLDVAARLAVGLRGLGLEPGDRVAILSENRTEWALTDYGCLLARVASVPIYDTLTADQVGYILNDSGSVLVFTSNEAQVDKVKEAARDWDLELRIVTYDGAADPEAGVFAWGDVLSDPSEVDLEAIRDEVAGLDPQDVCTILYTSGTTGEPKGVMLTHANLYSNVQACGEVLPIRVGDITLSFLPLSHVFQRMVDYLLFWRGCALGRAHSIHQVADDLKVVKPTIQVSVPRLYEKVYNKVMDATGLKAKIVAWATAVGSAWADAKLAGREPGGLVKLQYGLADKLVFSKIREGVGGRLRFFVSGGAPLSPEIAKFFYSAGLPILEGYGLTETSPVTNVNLPDRVRIGTVGPPVPNTEIRIADDGEILVRGPQVMKGYYNAPEKTAEVIDEEGWFATGDIGEITEDGCLRITDRKKDLIVTAGGKNVAPQPIENRLKTNPFVEQVVMVGDKRKFCALLVVPAFEVLERWATAEGIDVHAHDRRALLRDPAVQAHLELEILGHIGDDVARYERPKKIALLAEEFTIEDGTLTPTQKVKRRVIQERFADLIDRFYEESSEGRTVPVA